MPTLRGHSRDAERGTAFLHANGWISTAPAAFRSAFLAQASWRRCDAGDPISSAGDSDGSVFGVVWGALGFTSALGPADAQLATILHPGEWFGIVPMFTGAARNGSTVARTPCLLAHIDAAAIAGLLADRPEWWQHFGLLAIQYGNIAANIAVDLMIRDSRRRCLASLLRLAGARFRTPLVRPVQAMINQDELGAIANLSRNSVNRILRRAAADGLIEIGYHCITLHQPDALRGIVDGGRGPVLALETKL